MADRKISALTAMLGSSVVRGTDYIPIVDVSEVDADKNKRILINELRAGMFCGAQARKSVDQTVANYSAGAMVAWDGADVFDTDAWHDPAISNTRMTVPAGLGISKVLVIGNLNLALFANASTLFLEISKNGSVSFDGAAGVCPWPAASVTTTPFLSASSIINCTAGDYFELKLTTNDTSITVVAARSSLTVLAVG